MENKMKLIGTFTILHQGYLDLLDKYSEAEIYIISDELVKELTTLERDIRQIARPQIGKFFDSLKRKNSLLTAKLLPKIIKENDQLIIISDPISDKLVKKYLANYPKLILENSFLRHSTENVFTLDKTLGTDDKKEFNQQDIKYMQRAYQIANQSGCWWRQVGAILIKDKKILFKECNRMLPDKDECYHSGCIRDHIAPGEKMDFCSAIHAEINIIAQAANKGISIKNSSLYITHFPCPRCAKAIAVSGIKKLYFHQGWSNFDGEQVLKAAGVKLIKIDL